MSAGVDSKGRISPPRSTSFVAPVSSQSQSSSSRSPFGAMYPGFLSTNEPDTDYATASSPSSSHSADSPTRLPYLQNTSSPPSASGSRPFPRSPSSTSTATASLSPSRTWNPTAVSPSGTAKVRRRPPPLQLQKGHTVGQDEELQLQREHDAQMTAMSTMSDAHSTLSNDMEDLSLLRQSVKNNLIARPVDSPLAGSDSDRSPGSQPPDLQPLDDDGGETVTVQDALSLVHSSPQAFIMDTRPVGAFLDSHLPRSANVSIPSLIFRRYRNPTNPRTASWDSLAGFVTTTAGREVWDGVDKTQRIDVIVLGSKYRDDVPRVLRGVVAGLLNGGECKILAGGWPAVAHSVEAQSMFVAGEQSQKPTTTSLSTSLPPPRTAPIHDFAPPPIPESPTRDQRVSHHPSLPSLRASGPNKRTVPALSIQPSGVSSRRPPKLSLNLDKPMRSATLGSFQTDLAPQTPGVDASLLSVAPGPSGSRSPGLRVSVPKSGSAPSFQALCHAQSKLPPSPSSFGEVRRPVGEDEDVVSGVQRTPNTAAFTSRTARPNNIHNTYPTPSSPGAIPPTNGFPTARNGLTPFIVSTILPSFLFLGPEISSQEDVDTLKRLGVKRILNVAIECDDDEGLKLKENFERYLRVPMRDIVEESGVAKGMRDSCEFIDDARLHSAPIYVHCKAGKSRSVTVVLAYLIHANAWTLKTSYAYVAERRKGISPNIGFVAELMQFEEAELGLRHSGGVHGNESDKSGGDKDNEETPQGKSVKGKGKAAARYARESLPPAWAASLDSKPPRVMIGTEDDEDKGKGKDTQEDKKERRQVRDEREVRKNGQWVHHRRAPVDRTTLQPGRRVSKAGLESLRPLDMTSTQLSPSPSLGPGEEVRKESTTPGGEGRLGWV
ncbi:hypothetical protein BCR39DRAFT_545481 [Naematelia encephala]|uniref:protein-tyrosine-phosphatase n=1 Tax=Naematelia encephala TaxID=71784 RepID=A0A1Y2ASR4_9TREE|nr:hypothetical protein BCR39DRAFT_545481 [Naematelia encephala]